MNISQVRGFLEKPQTDEEIDLVRTDPAWIDARGIESRGRDCLGSMGIYVFNREFLVDVLTKTSYQDFGKEVFPAAFRARHVQTHLFDGYWEDIGTIKGILRCQPSVWPASNHRLTFTRPTPQSTHGHAFCHRHRSPGLKSAAA